MVKRADWATSSAVWGGDSGYFLGSGVGGFRQFEWKPISLAGWFGLFGLRCASIVVGLLTLAEAAVLLHLLEGVEGAEEVPADLGVIAEHHSPEIVFDHGDDEGFVFGLSGAGTVALALVLPLVYRHVAEALLHLTAS